MNKKIIFCAGCFMLFAVGMLLSAVSASAQVYSASAYDSFYNYPQTFNYYTLAGTSASQQRTGYQNLYNYDDPIIRCRQEGGTCAYPTSYLQTCGPDTEVSRFKVYVPPGTTNTYLATYLSGQTSQYVAVARLGQPPALDYDAYPARQNYSSLPTGGFNLYELKAGDCIGANSAGILTIATGGIPVAREADGGWLYVILIRISGDVIGNSFNNRVDTDAFMSWFRGVDWPTFGSAGGVVTSSPTPTPVPGATPTPTPTPTSSSDCGVFGCGNSATCVNNVCVPNSTTPTPTPTAATCNELSCLFLGGKCVNGTCVVTSPTPTPKPTTTPTPKPTPTPTPTPTPVPTLELTAKPLAQLSIETRTCQNVDLSKMNVILKADSPPSGNVSCYSALCYIDSQASLFYFAQKDILQKDVFINTEMSAIKAQNHGPFPSSGSWENDAFKNLFLQLSGVKCSDLVNSGIFFLQGYAPDGDMSQFQGAAFTFGP